jgi:hypothetical protein
MFSGSGKGAGHCARKTDGIHDMLTQSSRKNDQFFIFDLYSSNCEKTLLNF